jgi:hypothetical protein
MASYAPPTEDTAIFNGLYFTDRPITSSEGDARYLRLLAQGDEDMNDNDILNINQAETNSIKFSDNTIQTTAFTAGSGGVPTGTILPFAGTSALPSGYLLCDGTQYQTNIYPDLFTQIGYSYGGTIPLFAVPDMTNKFIMGATTSTGTTGGSNSDFITDANITPFQPTQAPVQTSNTSIAFNSSSGIPDWKYIKGEPAGDGSKSMWLPYTTSDNANGTNLVSALNVGTATSAFDKKPFHYLMVYIIKT